MPICGLCLQEKEIKASHLIPRFVGKWIKDTSATGFLTGAEKPEQRLQDLPTSPLLCSACEEIFSALETYFANKVFYPFLNQNIRSFDYDNRLQSFILSLSWRILKTDYGEVVKDALYHTPVLEKAEAEWRSFLLKPGSKIEPYENHLFFLEGKVDGKIPEKFDWYVSSGCDITVAGNEKLVLAYTKLPWMILVTSILPTHLDGWQGTLVEHEGKISSPQSVEDDVLGALIMSRVGIMSRTLSGPSSDMIGKRVLKAVRKDPERLIRSESFKTWLREKKRIYSEKESS